MTRWQSLTKHVTESQIRMASMSCVAPFSISRMLACILASSCDDSTRCLLGDAYATIEQRSCNDLHCGKLVQWLGDINSSSILHNWHQLETLCLYNAFIHLLGLTCGLISCLILNPSTSQGRGPARLSLESCWHDCLIKFLAKWMLLNQARGEPSRRSQ